jgi:hypothetical protein
MLSSVLIFSIRRLTIFVPTRYGQTERKLLTRSSRVKLMALDQGVVDSVTNANFKTVAEAASVGLAQAMAVQAQNLASHQQRLNLLAESSLAQMLNKMNALDPEEAASIAKVEKSDLGKIISELGSQIAGLQQMLKGAQTTLPETGR